jgi:predicted secreted protein
VNNYSEEALVRRLLILALVAVLPICSVSGCLGEVETYDDAGQAIDISVDQQFVIALGSNPTTGYGWQESYDETMLEIVEKTYEPGEGAEEGLVGAGGIEYFRFKALKEGETEITLVYKRAWEEEFLDQKVFTVNIE